MPNIFKKIAHIFIGWGRKTKVLRTLKAEKKLSELRLTICAKCSDSQKNKVIEIINGTAKYPETLVCNVCKCPCLQKSLVVDEECPKKLW